MKITIESTHMLTRVGGLPCRVWRGVTERGIACELAIPLVRVREDANCAEFEAELKELSALREEVVDMRFIW